MKPFVAFALIFALSFAVRIVYAARYVPEPDQVGAFGELERAAANIARTGELGNVFTPDSGPSAHVAPLYPYVLAKLFGAFGTPEISNRWPQKIFAVTVTSITFGLLPLLALRSGLHPAAGWLAGMLMALSPFSLGNESIGRWDQNLSAFALVLLLLGFLGMHANGWRSWPRALGLGVGIGLAGLLNPMLLPVVAILVLAEFFQTPGRRTAIFVKSAAMALISIACLVPWTIRNYQVFGGFVPIRTNFGLELMVGNNPHSDGTSAWRQAWLKAGQPNPNLHPYDNPDEVARIHAIGELAYMKEKQALAMAWIREHPGDFALLTLKRVRMFWFPNLPTGDEASLRNVLQVAYFNVVGAAGLLGLAMLFWTGHTSRWLFFAAVVGPALGHFITHVDLRYRYPTLALTMLLGCEVLVRIASRRKAPLAA